MTRLDNLHNAVKILSEVNREHDAIYFFDVIEDYLEIRVVGKVYSEDLNKMNYKFISHNDSQLVINF